MDFFGCLTKSKKSEERRQRANRKEQIVKSKDQRAKELSESVVEGCTERNNEHVAMIWAETKDLGDRKGFRRKVLAAEQKTLRTPAWRILPSR